MSHVGEIVRQTTERAVMGWRSLSATQQLMLWGLVVVWTVLGLGAATGGMAANAMVSGTGVAYTGTAIHSQFDALRQTDAASGELEIARLKLKRAEALVDYSTRYQVPADLVGLIYDTALREGIDPELAFRLVKIESAFVVRARSSAGALGLAQVQPATARFYRPTITPDELFDPARNLSIGFRYLRDLLAVYGDIKLALLAYNRGPARLKELLDQGRDPSNGYASSVMAGYGGDD